MKAIVQQELVAEAKQQGIIPTENKQQKHRMNDLSDDTAINNWSYFILFSYLYLIQGIISGIIGTMPYVYPHLPDYNTMALFGAQLMPFSFKFILAPFLQKYSIISYGKRKTWMVFGTLLGGISFIIASFVTDQKYSNLIAIFFIIAQTGMAILDIAAHAVMVKQIESKSQTSIIIGYSQVVGILIGGLILLKLTSIQFAKSVNLSHPITSPQTVILIFGIIILLPSFYIHFRFAQTGLQSEKKMDGFSFCQIISYYKVFLNTNSRYFRTCIFFLFILQGFNFFNCLYDYELVKKGFSKDMMNTLSNILVIPIVILTFFFGVWTNLFSGRLNSLIFILTATLAVDAYLRIVFPLQLWIVATTSFFTSVLDSWRFYIFAYMINDFRVHALTGMFITFLASFSNFGRQTSIHTWFCGKFTWQTCSLIGLGLQLLLIVSLPWFYGWVLAGDSEVPKEIQQQKKEKNSENQIQIAQN